MDFEQRLAQMEEMHRRHTERLRELDDTLTVMANIQQRQAAVQLGQAEWLERLQRMAEEREHSEKLHQQRMALFDSKMLEIEEKLNALIGVVDGMQRKPPAPPAA